MKNLLVTGAAGGIGSEIARYASKNGCRSSVTALPIVGNKRVRHSKRLPTWGTGRFAGCKGIGMGALYRNWAQSEDSKGRGFGKYSGSVLLGWSSRYTWIRPKWILVITQ